MEEGKSDIIILTTQQSYVEEERAEIITKSEDAVEAPSLETEVDQLEPNKPLEEGGEEKIEVKPKKDKAKKRKINMAWAVPPEDNPFAEPANYEDLTNGIPSVPDLPASKR